jgi:DNA-binding MarR family transcriptional regulator
LISTYVKIMTDPRADFATTLMVRDNCLCFATQRAARTLARRFDAAFRPLALTSGQFSLLNALNRPTPPAMAGLAEFLAMDRTTLTAALKPLVGRGLVTSTPDAADRRQRLLTLTDAGRALLARAWPIWISEHGDLEAGLDPAPGVMRAGLARLAQT